MQTVLGSNSTCITLADTSRPASESVGDVAAVAVGGNTKSQVTTGVDGAGVVHAGGLVEFLGAVSSGSVQELLEAVASCCAYHAILYHLMDLGFGTWGLHVRAVVAGT